MHAERGCRGGGGSVKTTKKIQIPDFTMAKQKPDCFKLMYGLSGIVYRVATLYKSYLTVTGIIMQSLKMIGQF